MYEYNIKWYIYGVVFAWESTRVWDSVTVLQRYIHKHSLKISWGQNWGR